MDGELREKLARIIDPDAYDAFDRVAEYQERPQREAPWSQSWTDLVWYAKNGSDTALAKADAILSAIQGEAQPVAWQEWKRWNEPPLDGTWFVAKATAGGWGAVRVVHYADKGDRLPIDHTGWVWPTVPTHWMSLADFMRAHPAPEQVLQDRVAALGYASVTEAIDHLDKLLDDHNAFDGLGEQAGEVERLRGALKQAREDILGFVNARWSEAEGSDAEHVGYIDAALNPGGQS